MDGACRRFRRVWSFLLLPPLGIGCLPTVAHSPRLDPGLETGVVVGFEGPPATGADPEDQGRLGIPYFTATIANSWVESDSGWGTRVGLSYGLVTANLDLFVRPPRVSGVDVGVGSVFFAGPLAGWFPYAQIGLPLTDQVYAFTTQGPTFVQHYRYGDRVAERPWMSVLGMQFAGRGAVQLGAVLGRLEDRCEGRGPGCFRPPRYFAQLVVPMGRIRLPRRWR